MLKQKIIYQLDTGAYKPVKAHEADAGFDLFAKEDVELSPDKTFKVDTGVHVLIPEGYVGLVLPRSSYNCAGVATPTGVIDAGYTGSISVVLVSKYDLRIFKGNASLSWSLFRFLMCILWRATLLELRANAD